MSSSKYQSRIPVEVSLGHPGLDFYFVLAKLMAKIYNKFITFFTNPEFTKLEFTKLEFTKLEFTKLEFTKLDVSLV
jgi:hypothetical protein